MIPANISRRRFESVRIITLEATVCRLTYYCEVEEQAHLGLSVDLAFIAARVAGAQSLDTQRVAAGPRTLSARGGRDSRVRREHHAGVRQNLQVPRPHPRHLRPSHTSLIKKTIIDLELILSPLSNRIEQEERSGRAPGNAW